MPQVTVYIRAEDMEAWKGVAKKSEFIHNALNDGQMPFLEAQRALNEAKVPTEDRVVGFLEEDLKPIPLDELVEEYDEVFGTLNSADLVLSVADSAVFDTTTEERIEATPAMIKQLKKLGQVI